MPVLLLLLLRLLLLKVSHAPTTFMRHSIVLNPLFLLPPMQAMSTPIVVVVVVIVVVVMVVVVEGEGGCVCWDWILTPS